MAFNKNQPETGVGVKKPNQVEYISKDEWEARIQNIARAKRDITWWAESFFKIVTLDKGLTQIKLYQKQRDLLNFITGNNRVLTLSSRQTGKCVFRDSLVQIKNKKTGKVQKISIEDLYNLIESQNKIKL